jgi:hypothetical protein
MMSFPVGAEDVKVVHGRSKGLQVMCSCGCINFNYLDPQDAMWRCRNCGKVLSNDFPRLLDSAVALQKQVAATEAAAVPPTPSSA